MVRVSIVEGVLVSIFIWSHHYIILSTDNCVFVSIPQGFKLESIWSEIKWMLEPRLLKSPILNSLIEESKDPSITESFLWTNTEFREIESEFLDPFKDRLPIS